MSGQQHPDTEAIADFQAGHTDGLRGRRLAAHVASCAECAAVSDQLAAVGSMLASVPAPPLPPTFESRISAAIADEAATREAAAHPATREAAAHPATREARHARSPRRQSGFRLRPAMAIVPVVACLLAGFGYLVSHSGQSSSSSYAEGQAAAPASSSVLHASGAVPAASPSASAPERAESRAPGFRVTRSGTQYEAATLRATVSGEIASLRMGASSGTGPTVAPSAAGTAAIPSTNSSASGPPAPTSLAGGVTASSTLVGCVLQVTGGIKPTLVDEATYQGNPAYIIAVPSRVWVVGTGCTASKPDEITSVAL